MEIREYHEQEISNILEVYNRDNVKNNKAKLISLILDIDNSQIIDNLLVICDSYVKRLQ